MKNENDKIILEIGDKFKLFEQKIDGDSWDDIGLMDKWLGSVMTVNKVFLDENYYFEAREDNNTWFWHEYMIDWEETKKLNENIMTATPTFLENAKEIKPENVEKFVEKCKTMAEIYEQKNKKYGNSFTKTYQEYGKAVLCIRLEDKLARAKQILLNGQSGSADESVIDTLIDLSAYSIMAILELEKENKNE